MENEEEIRKLFEEGQIKATQNSMQSFWSQEAVKLRPPRPTWEIMRSFEKDVIIENALGMGWADKKIQVKQHQINPELWEYIIEPYEEDCGCPSLLRYEDYITATAVPDTEKTDGY